MRLVREGKRKRNAAGSPARREPFGGADSYMVVWEVGGQNVGVSYASQVRYGSRMRPHNFSELSPQAGRPRPEAEEA